MGAITWPNPDHLYEDHGATVAEAKEALDAPDAIELTPDPASRSGKSSRVIGYSTTRGEVLCVILVYVGKSSMGRTAGRHRRDGVVCMRREERAMSKITEETARLVREIGDAAYDGDHDESLDGVTIRRRNAAAQVYSLRLGPEDVAALEAAASAAGLPPSTLARRFIVERLHSVDEGSPAALAAELADLSRKVAALA